jgi:glycosyltransferase involved in cell wall biosynthesis
LSFGIGISDKKQNLKKVLVISYYFPPAGGPGVQRVLKFVKYLPEFGWEPVILTVRDADFPARDESLLNEVPDGVQVFRTKIFEPYSIYRRLAGIKKGQALDVENIPAPGTRKGLRRKFGDFVRSNLFIPDARIGWRRFAVKKAIELVGKEGIGLIYSSSPPYTCSVIARDVKKAVNTHPALRTPLQGGDLKWVAGFRDPWTGFLNAPKRKGIAKKIDAGYEHSCMTEADAIEVAWEGIRDDILGKYADISSEKIHFLPNGFDPEDFNHRGTEKQRKFTITYTGSMYGVRNPESFLMALQMLLSERKIERENLRLIFAGRFGKEVRTMLDESSFRDSIEIIDYVSHAKAIEYMTNTNALLLVIDNTKDVARIIPGKVYEYLGARRPIIGIGNPHSDAARVISECGSGKMAGNEDIEGIGKIIMEYYEKWRNGEIRNSEVGDEDCISKYSRKEITGKLAGLFRQIVK